ncbi:hypothetical protein [Nonomuraea sp. NPDC046570]|uniref:effector-associated constant component EACC1 n=1 Tax=Nonomuraea sp. NPDC046570 TaxID=3155255 RepID=UPI0034070160
MTVAAFEADHDDLLSLSDWLHDADGLRGRVTLEHRPPAPGLMGGGPPALLVAVDTGQAASALVKTVEFWLRLRGRDIALRVRVGEDYSEMDLRAGGDPTAVLRQVETLLRNALAAAGE